MPSPRDFVLLALLLLMEILAGMSLLIGTNLIQFTGPGFASFWLLPPVALLAALLGLTLAGRQFSPRRERTTILSVAVVSAVGPSLVTSHRTTEAIATVIILGLAFWRGLVVVEETRDHQDVQRHFASGFAVYVLGLLFLASRGDINQPTIWHVVALSGLAFILIAMVALSVARLEQTREPGAGRSVLLVGAIQIGFLILVGFLALQLFAFDLAGSAGHLTQPFFDSIGRVAFVLVTLIAEPLQHLFQLLHPHNLRVSGRPATTHPPLNSPGGKRLKGTKHHDPTNGVVVIVIVVLILAGILTLIWRTLPRRQHTSQTARAYRQERQWLLSPLALLQLCISWLRSLLKGGAHLAGEAARATQRRVRGPSYPEDPIRRAYAQLLHQSASTGLPRPTATTPQMFEERLGEQWPDGAPDLAALTTAYVERRYGEREFTDQRISLINQQWQRLRALMRASSPAVVATSPETSSPLPESRTAAARRWARPWRREPDLADTISKKRWLGRELSVLMALMLAPIIISLLVGALVIGDLALFGGGAPSPQPGIMAHGIAFDSSGNLWITDAVHDQIVELSSSGRVLGRYGKRGSSLGELLQPEGIALDRYGHVFVADHGNNRIEEFSHTTGSALHSWGGRGSGIGQFQGPWGLAADSGGDLYVADTGNDRIVRIAVPSGVMRAWGTQGTTPGQLNSPHGVALDGRGDVYVTDSLNHRVQKFTAAGQLVRTWPTQETAVTEGELPGPTGIAIDTRGTVYVADLADAANAYSIQQFSSTGHLFAVWGKHGSGRLREPHGIAVDANGDIFVADAGNHRIMQFTVDGRPVGSLRIPNSGGR